MPSPTGVALLLRSGARIRPGCERGWELVELHGAEPGIGPELNSQENQGEFMVGRRRGNVTRRRRLSCRCVSGKFRELPVE